MRSQQAEQNGIAAEIPRPVWDQLFDVQQPCDSQSGLDGLGWANGAGDDGDTGAKPVVRHVCNCR